MIVKLVENPVKDLVPQTGKQVPNQNVTTEKRRGELEAAWMDRKNGGNLQKVKPIAAKVLQGRGFEGGERESHPYQGELGRRQGPGSER